MSVVLCCVCVVRESESEREIGSVARARASACVWHSNTGRHVGWRDGVMCHGNALSCSDPRSLAGMGGPLLHLIRAHCRYSLVLCIQRVAVHLQVCVCVCAWVWPCMSQALTVTCPYVSSCHKSLYVTSIICHKSACARTHAVRSLHDRHAHVNLSCALFCKQTGIVLMNIVVAGYSPGPPTPPLLTRPHLLSRPNPPPRAQSP